ncbi:DNA recombination protein RmuC [Limisalsivibrio acetivorans]|uniref:DNA recombination protein RmuC n=1 Tax=Limisalsivibrio acetivorans TaxID=1304888 RepID=UPI0003B3D520|nr:DNA recombination protein RmuC [Limisalsivibrio acetivorans]
MENIIIPSVFFAGLVIGAFLAGVYFNSLRKKQEEMENRKDEELESITASLKDSFDSLSMNALSRNSEEFLKLAKQERKADSGELESKKMLIDQHLNGMGKELEKVTLLINEFEKDRENKFSALSEQIKTTSRNAEELYKVTNSLKEALSSSSKRGRWAERMAEDILRAADFMENINYYKQRTMDNGKRPDFTFPMPNGMILNMDVKFPLDNYLKYLESENDQSFIVAFAKDVKARIKEVASREYIDPEANTLNFALLFMPNEQIYGFIMEKAPEISDYAFEQNVSLCSPVSLFSVLSVIRQAAENYAMEQTSGEVLSLIGSFRKQWGLFAGKLDNLGKKLGDAQKEYETLIGTRRRMLDRPLDKLEQLRQDRGLPLDED